MCAEVKARVKRFDGASGDSGKDDFIPGLTPTFDLWRVETGVRPSLNHIKLNEHSL